MNNNKKMGRKLLIKTKKEGQPRFKAKPNACSPSSTTSTCQMGQRLNGVKLTRIQNKN